LAKNDYVSVAATDFPLPEEMLLGSDCQIRTAQAAVKMLPGSEMLPGSVCQIRTEPPDLATRGRAGQICQPGRSIQDKISII